MLLSPLQLALVNFIYEKEKFQLRATQKSTSLLIEVLFLCLKPKIPKFVKRIVFYGLIYPEKSGMRLLFQVVYSIDLKMTLADRYTWN